MTGHPQGPLAVTLELASVPPTLNRKGSHWRASHGQKVALQRDLEGLLMASGLPRGVERVEARAVLRFPVRRNRDEGNFRWLLEKALGDALQNGGWLPNDTPDRFSFGALLFDDLTGPPRTLIYLSVWLAPRTAAA